MARVAEGSGDEALEAAAEGATVEPQLRIEPAELDEGLDKGGLQDAGDAGCALPLALAITGDAAAVELGESGSG